MLTAVTVVVAAGAVAAVLATWSRTTHSTVIAANAVGLIDARGGRIGVQVPVGDAPTALAVGAGALWSANSAADTVSRVDLASNAVQTISVGASPSGIAVCRGGVWVANHDDATVSWISAETSTVVAMIPVGAGPTAVACGFGSAWVTNADDRTVTRIDANTGRVIDRAIRTNAVGAGITVGGGSVWVTDEATRNVYGIDPGTNTVTEKATAGAGPTGIAYGSGSLWVANSLDDTVSRLDATTLQETAKIRVAGGPSSVSVSKGSVWVGSEFGSQVVRLDPRRGIQIGKIVIGNRPEGLAAAAGGLWVSAQASGKGHRGGRLVVLDGGLDSIDPAVANSTNSAALIALAYDGLTGVRRVGGAAGTQIVPDLAVAMPQPTANGTTYTFHLQPGIRYSDGRPLRAADFRRALARVFRIHGPAASSFLELDGARACFRHRRCDLSRSVIVHGASTLTLRLMSPDPQAPLPPRLSLPRPRRERHSMTSGPSLCPRPAPTHSRATRPVVFSSSTAIAISTAGRLPHAPTDTWTRSSTASSGTTRWPCMTCSPARPTSHSQVDLTGARVQQLRARHARQLHLDPQYATAFVFLNVRRPPFNDVRVRRALNYAVDRQRVAALHGSTLLAHPTCQLVPPFVPGYRPYCPYTIAPDAKGDWKAPDLARARALIRESGTRGESVVVWSFDYFHPESLYFVSLLRQLGYHARLHYIADIGKYFTALYEAPNVQAGFGGWFGGQLAVDWLGLLECSDAQHSDSAHFCNPRIDAQIARLAKEEPVDPAGTTALAATIDRELTDQAPWVSLFTPSLADVTSARVGNYEDNNGTVLMDQLWVR